MTPNGYTPLCVQSILMKLEKVTLGHMVKKLKELDNQDELVQLTINFLDK